MLVVGIRKFAARSILISDRCGLTSSMVVAAMCRVGIVGEMRTKR